MEKFTIYRLGYEYNGEIIGYSSQQTTCLETAKVLLEKENQESEFDSCVLFKETVVRERV